MVLWSVSLISSLSMAAVAGALSHMKPACARCPYSSVVQLTFKQDLHLLKICSTQFLSSNTGHLSLNTVFQYLQRKWNILNFLFC